jgi:hypothetical protein
MKKLLLHSLWLAVLAFFALTQSTSAQEARPAAGGDRIDRLERLERRVNEMAERQEQLLHRLGAPMERQGAGRQMPGARMQSYTPSRPGTEAPMPAHGDGQHMKKLHDFLGLLFLIGFLCNILLAIWIYTDIRKRNEGSGIFVAMALVAGIPAAIIYALTRIGDKKA